MQSFWPKLCVALDCPQLNDDPRFNTVAARLINRLEVDHIISDITSQQTVDYWVECLTKYDVPHAPVLSIGSALEHPQSIARDMVVKAMHPLVGEIQMVGRPIKFPGSPQIALNPPPVLGQHTREILSRELNLSSNELDIDKIEPLEGDSLRRHGPFPSDIEDIESSGLFIYLNSGKRSIAADIQTSQGQLVVHRLLSKADVFVTNHPLQLRQSLGLDATTLKARYPNLIIVSLSVFGDTGPYALEPSQTIDAYAVSGTAWVIGEPDRAPLSIPFFQADYQAGAHAASAIAMALIGRDSALKSNLLNQSLGASIDISSADIFAVASGTNGLIYLCYGLQKWVRAGRRKTEPFV